MFSKTTVVAASILLFGTAQEKPSSAPQSKAAESRKAVASADEFDVEFRELFTTFIETIPQNPAMLQKADVRAKTAPKALPILHQIVEFIRANEAVKHDSEIRDVEFVMFGLMLGDDAWTAEITKKSKAKEGSEFARLMLAGAKIATSEKEERAAAVREAAAMFKTENAANKNAFFSIMIVGDLAADELKQIQAAVAGYKDDALPRMVKGAITEKTAAAILPDKLNKPFALADKLADGGDFTTESMKGKVVLVDFWATWCGPCMEAMPDVEEMYKKYHADGLEVVGVSSDKDPADLKQFMEKRKTAPWPQMFDANKPGWHRFVEELGIDGIPRMLLIDRKGILRSIHAHEVMAEMIPKLLAEK